MRVGRSNYIDYALGEGPNETTIRSIIAAKPPDAAPNTGDAKPKEIDERFESRYETKYDPNNRILEKTTFSNDGKPTLTEKFTYGKDRRERVWSYSGQDSASKEIELFDANGNVVEEQNCDENGRKCDIEIFKYEFEAKGNWIVKKSFDKKTVRGKLVLRPTGTHF